MTAINSLSGMMSLVLQRLIGVGGVVGKATRMEEAKTTWGLVEIAQDAAARDDKQEPGTLIGATRARGRARKYEDRRPSPPQIAAFFRPRNNKTIQYAQHPSLFKPWFIKEASHA